MTSLSIEEISRRLCRTLDCLGYNPQMVQIRKNGYKYFDVLSSLLTKPSYYKTVGSRGEGMVKPFESDWDMLILVNSALVVEDHIAMEYIPESVSVFHPLPCLSHPGHYKLLLIRQGSVESFQGNCSFPFGNHFCLSSKEFMTDTKDPHITISGPAQTVKSDMVPYTMDHVYTFQCVCPKIIQQWAQRQRQYEWPPSELRERISNMPANIVPTGQKGCPDEDKEWRLCFNEIELLLVDSWNDTQLKLYKVLKMIKTDIIVKAGFDISSFIMKNIVMWLSEMYPQSDFKSEYLMAWVIKSLRLLKRSVRVYNLPYYIIPERNLIAERIPRCKRKDMMRVISDLNHCGPQLLWKCKKLEFAISMTPPELQYYKDRRDLLETLIIACMLQDLHGQLTNNDFDFTYGNILADRIVIGQWPQAVTEMLKDKIGVYERMMALLS